MTMLPTGVKVHLAFGYTSDAAADTIVFDFVVIVITDASLIAGELVPKQIALRHRDAEGGGRFRYIASTYCVVNGKDFRGHTMLREGQIAELLTRERPILAREILRLWAVCFSA